MKLVIISLFTRKDLQSPLKHFKEIEILHLYYKAPYDDMTKEELEQDNLVQYKGFFDLIKKIRNFKPDIIQGIEPLTFPAGFKEYFAILFYSLFFRKSYFFPMLENRPIKEKFGSFIGFFLKYYLKLYAGFAKFIFPLNIGAGKTLKEIGIKENKLKYIAWGCWGVNITEFKPNSQNKKDNTIIFVGRLDGSKGEEYLLNAFVLFHDKYPEIKLIIIGEGPNKDKLKSIIEKYSLNDNVELKGSVKNKDLPHYFQKALFAVMPSVTLKRWAEQVGMVNIQAMACATPVISTYSGAIPEYVPDGQGGILVPERDERELANAMIKLQEDSTLRKMMGKFARKYVEKNFDEERNVEISEKFLLQA